MTEQVVVYQSTTPRLMDHRSLDPPLSATLLLTLALHLKAPTEYNTQWIEAQDSTLKAILFVNFISELQEDAPGSVRLSARM